MFFDKSFAQDIFNLAPLLYGMPSLMFDIYVIFTLLRHFNTPFYRLFCWAQVSAWCMWIPGYIIFRAGRCSQWVSLYALMPVTGFVPTAIHFAYFYFSYVQWQMYFLLTLNRFISVYKPFNSAKIWRGITPILYAIVFTSPLIFTWQLIWYGAELIAEPFYHLNANEERSGIKNSMHRSFFLLLDGLATITMNVYIAYKLFTERRESNNALNSRDIRLFIFTCFLFASTLVSIVCQTYLFFNIRNMPFSILSGFADVQLFILDLHICTGAWFLMLLSRDVRQKVLGTFTCSCK